VISLRPALAVAIVAALLGASGAARAGESAAQLYTLNCWGCHRPGGEGIPGTAPPLKGAADFLKVPGGRAYLIRVPGVAQSPLNDAQAAAVMNWIMTTFNKDRLPHDFTPYTAEEIHRYRAERLLDVAGARKALVAKMAALGIRAPAQ
jgi:mono/diheme cytochrome c family protein